MNKALTKQTDDKDVASGLPPLLPYGKTTTMRQS
jgi:hypothetical protein